MKKSAVSLLLLSSLIGVTAHAESSDCATRDGFLKIRSGMSYRQVVQTLGCEGEQIAFSEMMGIRTAMYAWTGSGVSGLMGGNMNATFENGRMISKAQLGLQ